jgi:hypothetical protein
MIPVELDTVAVWWVRQETLPQTTLQEKEIGDITFVPTFAHLGITAYGCSHILSNFRTVFCIRVILMCYAENKVIVVQYFSTSCNLQKKLPFSDLGLLPWCS